MSRHSKSFCRWKSKRCLAAGGEGGGGAGGLGGGGGLGGALGEAHFLLSSIPSLYCANANENKIPLAKTVNPNATNTINDWVFTMRPAMAGAATTCLLF